MTKWTTFWARQQLNLLQLWVWERFPVLLPEIMSCLEDHHLPRAAPWDSLQKWLDSSTVCPELETPTHVEWIPYRSSNAAPLLQHDWVSGDEITRSNELQPYVQCIHACELAVMYYNAMYYPYRVARKLGLDQDVTGTAINIHSSCKESWTRY